ncbi:NAD(P)H-flavin reductase [Aestuariibacter salexigens]|uniref:NAD(P)H-flavin reductase n=1 Tax=Aestuariibacter salexigens TaxID=226010 RepID=UPI00042619B1|nr:NAD(P)H-flavin reductase [Aestuariibacter salexigens]
MQQILCKVDAITPLTDTVHKVQLVPLAEVTYRPGQYLMVVMGEGDKRPFSIASVPAQSNMLELHIGAEPGNTYAGEVLDAMRERGEVVIEGGAGDAYLREEDIKPTVLVAGGTGFSYTWSILQARLANPSKEPVFLYWGVRKRDDMYAFEVLQRMQNEYAHFTFMPVVEFPEADWQGKTGWVHKAVMEDFISLEPYQVYIAGRFEMAGVAREDFHTKGLMLENLYGDAYAFI